MHSSRTETLHRHGQASLVLGSTPALVVGCGGSWKHRQVHLRGFDSSASLRKIILAPISLMMYALHFQRSTARDHLANERTLLAWWNTGMTFFSTGIALFRCPVLFSDALLPFTPRNRLFVLRIVWGSFWFVLLQLVRLRCMWLMCIASSVRSNSSTKTARRARESPATVARAQTYGVESPAHLCL